MSKGRGWGGGVEGRVENPEADRSKAHSRNQRTVNRMQKANGGPNRGQWLNWGCILKIGDLGGQGRAGDGPV